MTTILIAIAAFLPVLAILVVVHEWGHYVTARAFGVKVLEFGFGYPPRILGIRTGRTRLRLHDDPILEGVSSAGDIRVGDYVVLGALEDEDKELLAVIVEVYPTGPPKKTGYALADRVRDKVLRVEGPVRAIEGDTLVVADMLYSINLLPLGGFVRLAGENHPRVPRSLAGKGPGARFIVLAAGAFMNAVLAIAILSVVLMLPRDVTVGQVTVTETASGSPAAQAGIEPGDVVASVSGRDIQNTLDLERAIALNLGSQTEWELVRGGQDLTIDLTPRFNPPEGQGEAGLVVRVDNPSVVRRSSPPWLAIPEAFGAIGDMMLLFKNEISKWTSGGKAPELAGPVGIAQATGEVASRGDVRLLFVFAAFLSMNLAIINILPIPMLDGGRIVFVAIEWVRRGKRISPSREGLVHLVGFALLIGLVLAITFGDLARIVRGDSLLG